MRLPILLTILCAGPALAQSELRVYVPDYFASDWGPGPKIESLFEQSCDCDVIYETGDLVPRLMLEGAQSRADVVLGLNSDQMKQARASGALAPHGVDLSALTLPIAYTDEVFVPFDYGHVAFMYNTDRFDAAPASLEALAALPDDVRIALNDPRSSSSGLAMALWIDAVYGEAAQEFWAGLAPKIETVTGGWSEGYGLFTEGQVDIALSFTTSPAYHIVAEGDETKRAMIFEEGHYLYLELAALGANAAQPELAREFLSFLTSRPFQEIIAEANWSLPAALERSAWPEAFQALPWPETVHYYDEETAHARRDQAIEAWRAGLSQ